MNVFGWVLLVAVAVAAAVDWYAVLRRRRIIDSTAAPVVILLLLAFAWLGHAEAVWAGRFLLLGLVLCVVGDLLLLDRPPADERFVQGLVAFLLAHLAYLGAVLTLPGRPPLWAGVAVVLVAAAVGFWRLRPALAERPGGGGAVTAYVLVLGLVTALAWWRGHPLLALGLSLFCASDALIGWNRFSRTPVRHGVSVAVTVLYHLGQVLVVLGVVRPDLLA